jgi:uncharacterized repeat protein (TIGR01451 family)
LLILVAAFVVAAGVTLLVLAQPGQTQEESPEEADLVVTKTDSPDPVKVGGTVTYLVTITNNGPDTASNISLTDDLPDSLVFFGPQAPNFIEGPTDRTSGGYGGDGTRDLDIVITFLDAGETLVLEVVGTLTEPGCARNTVGVDSDAPDPDSTYNSAATTTTVGPVECSDPDTPPPPPPSPDADSDSVRDSEDNCPNVANPNQEDADRDGAGDACDQMPKNKNKSVKGGGKGRSVPDSTETSPQLSPPPPIEQGAGQESEAGEMEQTTHVT